MAKKPKKEVDDTMSFTPAPYYDHNRHTVFKFGENKTHVKFVPLDIVEGLKINELTIKQFNSTYKQIPNYPIERAVKLFFQYSQTLGATKEVMEFFSKIVNLSEEDIKLATTRRETEIVEPVIEKPKKVPVEKPAKKERSVKSAMVQKSTQLKPRGSKKSAAQMFKDLIMDGKLTDKEIFKKVQDEFALDDSKFGYVKWYRNNLIKSGMKPPAAKGDK